MANEESFALLKQSVEAWNKWRVKHPDIIPNLSAADLSETVLRGANLSEADLSEADLSEADLSEADLIEADLSAANLCGTVLWGANLSGAHFIEADLRGANLNRANLSEAVLSGADLSGADLNEAVFTGAVLSRAYLSSASLRGVNLSGANLSEAVLSGAILSGAVFGSSHSSGFRIRAANLSGAYLYTADLSGTDLSGTNLSGANLSGANLSRANLSRANLSEANLRGSDLREANINEAILSGVEFCKANLSGLNFSRLNLSGLNFSEANLSGVNFAEANLNRVDLSGSDLSRSDLSRIQALETDFTAAILTGACIEDWHTNSASNLSDVICEFIYLRQGLLERRPSDINRKFALGEFTKLFQKAQQTVDLIFRDGIDWKAFITSFQKLQVECSGEELSIQAIENKNDGAFVIRVNVPDDANKATVEKYLKREYELALEAKNQEILFLRENVEYSRKDIENYRHQNTNLLRIIQTMAEKEPTNKTTIHASTVGFVQSGSGTISNFSQNINKNIDEITKLINSLREKAQEFPQDKCEEALVHLDDLQEDISKTEKRKPERIKTRIIALITIAGTVLGVVANSADFTNNALELADKLGIEISQPQEPPQQLPPSTR